MHRYIYYSFFSLLLLKIIEQIEQNEVFSGMKVNVSRMKLSDVLAQLGQIEKSKDITLCVEDNTVYAVF